MSLSTKRRGRNLNSAEMTLWTIQRPEAVHLLEKKGTLITAAKKVHPDDRSPYKWMASQMRHRIGDPLDKSTLPLWAWHTYQDDSPRPDLRRSGHLPRGERAARIEFAVAPSNVLLSDFMLWHYVLGYWYLPKSAKDEREFSRALREHGLESCRTRPIPNRVLDDRLTASWVRIFEIGQMFTREGNVRADQSIQATLWVLPLESVKKIEWFTAR